MFEAGEPHFGRQMLRVVDFASIDTCDPADADIPGDLRTVIESVEAELWGSA